MCICTWLSVMAIQPTNHGQNQCAGEVTSVDLRNETNDASHGAEQHKEGNMDGPTTSMSDRHEKRPRNSRDMLNKRQKTLWQFGLSMSVMTARGTSYQVAAPSPLTLPITVAPPQLTFTCQYCGAKFSHGPAHKIHESAHLKLRQNQIPRVDRKATRIHPFLVSRGALWKAKLDVTRTNFFRQFRESPITRNAKEQAMQQRRENPAGDKRKMNKDGGSCIRR